MIESLTHRTGALEAAAQLASAIEVVASRVRQLETRMPSPRWAM